MTGLARHTVASSLATTLAALVAFAGPSSTRSAAASGSSGVFDPDAPPETRYRYYLQHRATTTLRNAGIDATPSGRSRRLGSELDLVLGLEDIFDRFEVRAVLGYFAPGAAFAGSHGGAWIFRTEIQVRFWPVSPPPAAKG